MPAYKTGKRTQQYSNDFNIKAALWSHEEHQSVKEVAEALDTHPFMLSRWRKEYRKGKVVMHGVSSQSCLLQPMKETLTRARLAGHHRFHGLPFITAHSKIVSPTM
ncbi:transposase [Zobellella aerophila]|uniref:transposase n=1 Tax=Zobellella aerophila TaxID=870480 RepID=UPI0031E60492